MIYLKHRISVSSKDTIEKNKETNNYNEGVYESFKSYDKEITKGDLLYYDDKLYICEKDGSITETDKPPIVEHGYGLLSNLVKVLDSNDIKIYQIERATSVIPQFGKCSIDLNINISKDIKIKCPIIVSKNKNNTFVLDQFHVSVSSKNFEEKVEKTLENNNKNNLEYLSSLPKEKITAGKKFGNYVLDNLGEKSRKDLQKIRLGKGAIDKDVLVSFWYGSNKTSIEDKKDKEKFSSIYSKIIRSTKDELLE